MECNVFGLWKKHQWITVWLRAYPTFYMCNCNSAMQGSPTGMKIEFSRSLPTLLEGQESLGDGVYDNHSGSHGLKLFSHCKKRKSSCWKKKKKRHDVECIISSMLMINKSLRSPAGRSFVVRVIFYFQIPHWISRNSISGMERVLLLQASAAKAMSRISDSRLEGTFCLLCGEVKC